MKHFCSKQYNNFFYVLHSHTQSLILIIIIYTTENLLELKSARYGLWFSIIVPKSTTKLLDNIFELFNFKRTIYYDQKFYMKFCREGPKNGQIIHNSYSNFVYLCFYINEAKKWEKFFSRAISKKWIDVEMNIVYILVLSSTVSTSSFFRSYLDV